MEDQFSHVLYPWKDHFFINVSNYKIKLLKHVAITTSCSSEFPKLIMWHLP